MLWPATRRSSLDILDLLEELKAKTGVSIVLISHNLNMVTERSDRIIVIYAGKLQEIASTEEIVNNPLHPYTIGLMNSLPNIADDDQKLVAIPGELPDLTNELRTSREMSSGGRERGVIWHRMSLSFV